MRIVARSFQGILLHRTHLLATTLSFPYPAASTNDPDTPRPGRRDNLLSSLTVAAATLNLAKEVSSIAPAKAVFGPVSIILTMINGDSLLLCSD